MAFPPTAGQSHCSWATITATRLVLLECCWYYHCLCDVMLLMPPPPLPLLLLLLLTRHPLTGSTTSSSASHTGCPNPVGNCCSCCCCCCCCCSSSISPVAGLADDITGSRSNDFGSDKTDSTVHSFEVNIVLEYCDWGCLRDALDQGTLRQS